MRDSCIFKPNDVRSLKLPCRALASRGRPLFTAMDCSKPVAPAGGGNETDPLKPDVSRPFVMLRCEC